MWCASKTEKQKTAKNQRIEKGDMSMVSFEDQKRRKIPNVKKKKEPKIRR